MFNKKSESGSNNASYKRDWTQGSIFNNLLKLAWPLVISSILSGIGPIIDMVWVGKLGAASVAGVGVGTMLVMLLDMFKMGLDMGTRAIIARFIGAGDEKGATNAALQGYVVTIGFAAIVGTIGFIFAGPILKLMGLSEDIVAQGAPYLRLQFITILTMGIVRQNDGTMQFAGDTINPMKIAIIYRALHVAVSPLLIFGWLFIPGLGTAGAAYAGIISSSVGAAVGLWMLMTGRTRLKLSFRNFRPDSAMIWRIVKIGVPASITGIERNLGQVLLVSIIAPFGTVATAAHTLIQSVTQLVNIGGSGFGQGTSVLAGQNHGAGRSDRAAKSVWIGISAYTAIMLVSAIGLFFWGDLIIQIFNKEPGVVALGHSLLKIQAVGYIVWGVVVVIQNSLNGLGDTLGNMVVTLVSVFIIELPLAWALSRYTSMGIIGAYWGIVIGTVVMAAIYAFYFKSGKWMKRKF